MLERLKSFAVAILARAIGKILPVRPDLAVEFPVSYADLIDILLKRTPQNGPSKHLMALVLANPEHPFVKNNILPLLEEWHFLSDKAVTFVFFGYTAAPFRTSGDDVVRATPEFSAGRYVKAVRQLEAATSIRYTGRTMLVLTAANTRSKTPIDYEWVLDFDIEGLIKAGAIDDVRVLFEQIIRLAEEHPADDALWAIQENLSDDMKHESFMNAAQGYIPFLKSSRDVARAHTTFRVRDRRAGGKP